MARWYRFSVLHVQFRANFKLLYMIDLIVCIIGVLLDGSSLSIVLHPISWLCSCRVVIESSPAILQFWASAEFSRFTGHDTKAIQHHSNL